MKISSILSVVALGAGLQFAGAQSFISNMDGAQDGGGARQGTGTVGLTLVGSTLTLSGGSYSGLTANSSAAHIHGPAVPGVNASVLYDLGGVGIVTLGSTSGTISGVVNIVNGIGGFTLAQQLTQLNSGLWYINIHNASFPGGEIRGQITVVPEPTSAVLLVLGGVCAGWFAKRKRRQL